MTIDITDLTDNTLDAFLAVVGGNGDDVDCEALTVTERHQLAAALHAAGVPGWAPAALLSSWIAAAPAYGKPPVYTRDYEGLILDEADERYGDYL